MLQESIMYYEEFVSCSNQQGQDEMVVRGCNSVGYVYNLIVCALLRCFFLLFYDDRFTDFSCQLLLVLFFRPQRTHEICGLLWLVILDVCQSESLSVTLLCCANTAEWIKVLLGVETLWGPSWRNIVHKTGVSVLPTHRWPPCRNFHSNKKSIHSAAFAGRRCASTDWQTHHATGTCVTIVRIS